MASTERRYCYECGELILKGDDHITLKVYDTPWGPPKEITVHTDNADNSWETCESRLSDTGWRDFRYFECDCCRRRVCRENQNNGWHSYVRIFKGKEICLRCYIELQLWEGASRESFEGGRVEGTYYPNGDLTAYGFELVPEFFGYHLKDTEALKKYCFTALNLISQGYVIVNEYDLTAIDGQEGFVTMWRRRVEGQSHEKRFI